MIPTVLLLAAAASSATTQGFTPPPIEIVRLRGEATDSERVSRAMRGCAQTAAGIRGDRFRFYRGCVQYRLRPDYLVR